MAPAAPAPPHMDDDTVGALRVHGALRTKRVVHSILGVLAGRSAVPRQGKARCGARSAAALSGDSLGSVILRMCGRGRELT